MKVGELIQLLEEQDSNAAVMIMGQSTYPFENAVAGVAVRKEMLASDDEDVDEEEREEPRYEKDTAPNDVFLVEGRQLRYGSKAAWRVAKR
jgi:hypothetical protein